MLTDALVLDGVRTPIGKVGGALSGVRPDDLAATAVKGLLERHPDLDPETIEEVYFGDANGAGEDNRNVARMAVLLAGLPVSIPGATVNRLCGSGLEAVSDASRAVAVGEADLIIAGGVESMTPRAVGAAQAVTSVPDHARAGVELGARLADGEPEDAVALDSGARRGRRDPRRRALDHTRGAGSVRARVARARREGVGRRRVRRRSDPGPGRGLGARRVHPRGHDAREARVAEAGVPRGWHRHSGQLVADERRRRRVTARFAGRCRACGARADGPHS